MSNAMPVGNLTGRTALVTGAARGVGRASHLFCQPESDFITGEVLVASGGLRM